MCLEDTLVLAQCFDFQVIIRKNVPHHTCLFIVCQWWIKYSKWSYRWAMLCARYGITLDNVSASCERCIWNLVVCIMHPGPLECTDVQANFSQCKLVVSFMATRSYQLFLGQLLAPIPLALWCTVWCQLPMSWGAKRTRGALVLWVSPCFTE